MNAAEESDRLIVALKTANEAKAKEPLERRGRTKENMIQPVVTLTQSELVAILNWTM